jgi:CRP-like cAMP-binding protein
VRGILAQRAGHLRRCQLFDGLCDARLADVAALTRERHYLRNEYVFHKRDRPAGLYVVVTGRIKESCQSFDGSERILDVRMPCQTFGDAALLLDAPYPYFCVALVKTHVLLVERRGVLALLESEPGFAARMLGMLSYRMHNTLKDIEAYSLKTPLQRLAGFLIGLQADSDAGDAAPVALPYAKGVIASRLGMTAEALSRALRDLAEVGIIDVRGNRVMVMNGARLQELAV